MFSKRKKMFFVLQHSRSVSTPGGLLGAVLRVEVLLGVGTSEWDVGVLDLDTGVVDFSFYKTKKQSNLKHKRFKCCSEQMEPISLCR